MPGAAGGNNGGAYKWKKKFNFFSISYKITFVKSILLELQEYYHLKVMVVVELHIKKQQYQQQLNLVFLKKNIKIQKTFWIAG